MRKFAMHAIAGTLAMLIISTFWTSTLISELFMGDAAVVAVKHAIVSYGFALLIFVMLIVGGSGNILAKGRTGGLIGAKKKRMHILAANALLVMIPCALYLNHKASSGQLDGWFYTVQIVELVAGLIQLSMLGSNFRDGLILTGKWSPRSEIAGKG